MFVSWGGSSSPRSIQGVLGLNRLTNHFRDNHHIHTHRESLCAKISYVFGIATLASILWVWALLVHDIYKHSKTRGTLPTVFYMTLATVLSVIVFMLVLYATITLCRPQRRSSSDHAANQQGQTHHEDGVLGGQEHAAQDGQSHRQDSQDNVVSPV